GADGFSLDYRFGDLPPNCPSGVGNDKRIGAACTNGGEECGPGMLCACQAYNGITPPVDTPCFCTVLIPGPCTGGTNPPPAGFCGQGATCCSYMQLASICVPDVCLFSMMCPVI
ncbi:MAG: hypothetical protein H7X95_10725, partial [Deltaproteobacteria bacterium]|nr:hypothetical protein [Deltaproteobacteria bacterium]